MKSINSFSTNKHNYYRVGLFVLFISWTSIIGAATYIVTTTADSGPGSLRDAINQVNAGIDNTINFNIPTSDPGYNASANTWTIKPATDLPTIIHTVTIDGYTQSGSSVNTLAQGDNAVLTIVLNGINVVSDGFTTGNGLHFGAGSDASVVRGLVINQWFLNGILIDGTNGTINGIQILGNFIGTNATGTQPLPTRTGVGVSGATNQITNTIIGTPLPADRNIFGGSFGYLIFDSFVVRGACICSCYNTGTTIQNNYIGTDTSGTQSLGLSQVGIMFISEHNSLIGGAAANELNLISGQTIYGVTLTNTLPTLFPNPGPGCFECTIEGNYIGTDITGTNQLGNANAGIEIDSFSTENLILNNLISGNGIGIRLGQFAMPGSINNIVQGNKIGTDSTGTQALPNEGFGIIINDNQNIIGGSNPIQANIISGNGKGGILVYGATETTITGNYIGTDITGEIMIGNGGNGIQLGTNGTMFCAASSSIIGS